MHLEGGGWCIDEADCVARSKTDLGSSKAWKPIGIPPMDGGVHGMFNPDPTLNTEFFNYTKVGRLGKIVQARSLSFSRHLFRFSLCRVLVCVCLCKPCPSAC